MTISIDDAIKVLSDDPKTLNFVSDPFVIDSLKLAREAMKRVQDMRISPCTTSDELLPGETPEEES